MRIYCDNCKKESAEECKCAEPKWLIDFTDEPAIKADDPLDVHTFKMDLTIGLGVVFTTKTTDPEEIAYRAQIVRRIQIDIEEFCKKLQAKYHQNEL